MFGYVDLFSGAGGGSLGVEMANPKSHCFGHFEINKDAIKILEKNFPTIPNYGSVEDAHWKSFQHIDLIIGGSPCTDLSIIRNAGKSKQDVRENLEGKDSKLFYDFVKAIEVVKPKYFLLENVASMSNAAKDEISSILGVQPIRINSKLVSAQNRDRLYWCNWETWQPEDKHIQLMDIKIRDQFKFAYAWSKSTRGKKVIVENGDLKKIPQSFDERFRVDQKGNCMTGSVNGSESMTFFSTKKVLGLPRKVWNRSELLPYNLAPGSWRKILPIEAERLQTFPDYWCQGVSNSAAYRLMGKAMTAEIITHLIKCNKELMS
tara:strand:+ start:26081 stop:27037 length:957 start_codon:yes stop_codon:yes gene_type:complete